MATMGFHYEDRPPQHWLDELYNFQIPRLWDIKLNATQRANLTVRAKQQLKDWRLALRDQFKKIENRYGKEQIDEKRLMLAPYQKLDLLATEMIDAMADLEAKLAANRPIPEGFSIGDRIFGSIPSGRWYFGSIKDAKRYEEFEKLERRFMSLRKEYLILGEELKVAYARVKDQQNELDKATKRHKQLTGFLQIGLRLLIVMIVVVFCLVLGGFVFMHEGQLLQGSLTNQAFGGTMMGLGVIGAIVAIVLARRRRRTIAALEEDITALKQNLAHAKKEAHRQKKLFFPTEQTFKEVSREYKQMKLSFEAQ